MIGEAKRVAGLALIGMLVVAPSWGQAQVQPQPRAQLTAETITLRELAAVIAERDRQYAQRFEAQEKAVVAALAAQQQATAAALAAQEKATAAAFSAASTAVAKAELANEKRLDSVNEFRGQLKDQATTLATRIEVTTQFKAFTDKLDTTAAMVNEMRSRWDGASTLWAAILAVLAILITLAIAFMRSRSYPAESPVNRK